MFAHVPKVQILPAPSNNGIIIPMKKKLLVEKSKFDAMLSRVVQANPVPRTSIKATGKRGSKSPILAKQ